MTEADPATPSPSDASDPVAHWFAAHRPLLLGLAALFALFWTLLYLQFTVDDAFISFRYGKNLLIHHSWNWNPPGLTPALHEEAYTSLLYAVLSFLPALLHLSPALFFKFFGLACVGAMLYRLRTQAASPFAFLLGTVLLAANPFVWIHAYAGLETPLYMLLLLEMGLAVHRASTVSAVWPYTLFLLLPLTRPEGLVFGCVGVVLFWRSRGRAAKRLDWFGVALLLGLVYFAARWHYFHHLLPNPYYAKVYHDSWADLGRAFADNLSQFKGYVLTLVLLLLAARSPATRLFAVAALLLMLLFFMPRILPMNYADRFYFQLTFPVVLLFLVAEEVAPMARLATIVAVVSLGAITVEYLRSSLTYFPTLERANLDLGRRLAPFAEGHTLLAGEAGAIPYYSNWTAYDFLGLGTHSLSVERFSLPQLERLHPDLILIFAAHPGPDAADDPDHPGPLSSNRTVSQYLRLTEEYEYAGASRANGYYLVEFLRRDTPQAAGIRAALEQNTRSSETGRLSVKDLLLQRYVPWLP